VEHTVGKGSVVPESLEAHTLVALSLASELNKEEPLCGRHASGRDKTLASELSLDGW